MTKVKYITLSILLNRDELKCMVKCFTELWLKKDYFQLLPYDFSNAKSQVQ